MHLLRPACSFCFQTVPELEVSLAEYKKPEVCWKKCKCGRWNVVSELKPPAGLKYLVCNTPNCTGILSVTPKDPEQLGAEVKQCEECEEVWYFALLGRKVKCWNLKRSIFDNSNPV